MLPDNINELPPEVLNGILKLLNIDIGEFMQRLINDEPYEIKIYAWIYTRYQENNHPKNKNFKGVHSIAPKYVLMTTFFDSTLDTQ